MRLTRPFSGSLADYNANAPTAGYLLELEPVPLPGEEPRPLPGNVVIDLMASYAHGKLPREWYDATDTAGDNAGKTGGDLMLARYNDAVTFSSQMDLMFSPAAAWSVRSPGTATSTCRWSV